jgi:flagellar hook-associated protein 1
MSLSAALSTAQSILSNTSTQTSVISKNISNVGNADYGRREAQLATNQWGAQVVSIARSANDVLFRNNMANLASASGQATLLDGIEQLRALLGGQDYETSTAALMGNFRGSLELFASKPGDMSAAQSAIAEAVNLADSVRKQSTEVQKLRRDTDSEISRQVGELNKLLGEFERANNEVKKASQTGRDANDALDERDRLLKSISEIVGVTTVVRSNNDIAIYTKDGATLFETVPRPVTFAATPGYDAGTTGNAVLIDGVPLRTGVGGSTSAAGSLSALLQIRDVVAPTAQAQLDEMARGLVAAMPELFQTSAPGDPTAGILMPGAALSLTVNPAMNPLAGGDPMLLRDGLGYAANPTRAAGFSELLDSYVLALNAPMDFDVAAQGGERSGLLDYAAGSVGWLEAFRQQADQATETKSAAYFRSTEALSNAIGVNLDEEMSRLLALEQSYKASARLIAAVDEMLNSLLSAVR